MHIRTGTLEAECRGEHFDRRTKQSRQNNQAPG
jgi:hypothetical protein